MPRSNPLKREIRYADFDDMLADVDQLAQAGYVSHGQWSLGQATSHVADWMSYPMDGFPTPPWFIRAVFWFLGVTGMTAKMAEKIKAEGFQSGMATAPQTVQDPAYPDAEGIAKLRRVVAQFRNHDGPLQPSPLFGELDAATHEHVTLLHAAHHFGYLAAQPTQ